MDHPPLQKKTYLKKNQLLALTFIICGLLSYFVLPKAIFWDPIDQYTFKFINSVLALGKPIALFIAFLNHRIFDFILDGFYLFLVISYIQKPNGKSKKEKLLECLLICFLIAFCIIVINRQFFRYIVDIDAISPTLKFKNYFHINHILPFFKTKVYSHSSFPGDHATTAFLFYFLTNPLFGTSWRLIRRTILIIALLPRLIVGAHNLSDIVIGSSIVSFLIYVLIPQNVFF